MRIDGEGKVQLKYPRHEILWARLAEGLDQGDISHDRDHVLRVYRWAVALAPEAGADPDLAGAAAIVHDLELIPKDSADRALGGERSALAAPAHLVAAGYNTAEIAEITDAVRTSSWSRGLPPEGPVGAVLQDADRLDAIGIIGAARTFSCAQVMAARSGAGRLWHALDPLGHSDRTLNDRSYAVDHFKRKLLKLSAGMHTPGAQAEAARRHASMLALLEALGRELAGP